MMQILYLIAMYGPRYLGNIIHQELGHEFQAHGHTIQVFALSSAQERGHQPADTIESDIAVHRALTAGTFASNLANRLVKPIFHYERFGMGWWTLRNFLTQHPTIDLILAEGAYPFGALAALASKRQKLVITVAGGDFINSRATQYGYGRFRTARTLMRYAFQRAAAIRVTTPLVQDQILALGAAPEKIVRVPRNIAAHCFAPSTIPLQEFRAQARRALTEKYNIGNAHIIVAAGRLLPIKGFDLLIRGLAQVQTQAGETRLLLVGPNRIDPKYGDYQKYLEQLAHTSGVHDKIIFTGAIPHDEMPQILAAADVIAVPSILEGMNKIVVEGAAVGTPSIVTRTAGIADLMAEADIGTIVEPNNPEAFAACIAALLNAPERCTEMRARARIWAEQFSARVVGTQLVNLCERVV